MSGGPTPARTLVWDAPVRVFHWLLAICVAGAFVTSESERWRLLHATLGYSAGGLVAFRLLWGFIGTRHARFRSFLFGPSTVSRYLVSLLGARPEHHVGHNPAGGLAVVALLSLVVFAATSGHMVYADLGGRWLESVHEFMGEALMLLVGVHVAAVVLSSAVHRENLVGAMITGRKAVPPCEGIRAPHRILATVVAATVLGFWAIQWAEKPTGEAGEQPRAVRAAAEHSAAESRNRHD